MAGELAAEWIKIPDGNGNLQKVWVRDSTARRDIAQLQTDVSGLVIPDPSDTNPQMDGTAAAGSSADYSRADHVHPTDTSRQAALSQTQLDAVNSGITAAKVSGYDAIQVPTATSELTNDSGFITSAKFGVVTGTTDSASGTDAAVPYPTGFTVDNCIILSLMIAYNNAWRYVGDGVLATTSRVYANLESGGVSIYHNTAYSNSQPWKVVLMRTDI